MLPRTYNQLRDLADRICTTGMGADIRLRKNVLVMLQILPIVVLVSGFLFLPLAGAIWDSFNGLDWDFSRYRAIVNDPIYTTVLFRSLTIAATTSILCVALGYPIAYFMTTLERRQVSLFSIVLLIPLFTAFLIRTYGWMAILGRRGALNMFLMNIGVIEKPLQILGTSWAVYIGIIHVLLPLAILIMYASMAQLDRSLLASVGVLGAHPVRAFIRVYFPMSVPAIVSASMLIFIISIGFYITPVLLGGPSDTMIAQFIVNQITTLLNFRMGYALAGCLLAITIAVLIASNFFVPIEQIWSIQQTRNRRRNTGGSDHVKSMIPSSVTQKVLYNCENLIISIFKFPIRLIKIGRNAYIVLVSTYLIGPLIIVYILSLNSSHFQEFPPPGFSLQWYKKFFSEPQWIDALFQSIKLAVIVASIAVVVGATAAFGLVRGNLKAKRALFLFILSPLLLPLIILALSLYVSVGAIGLLGSFPGLVIGHMLVCVPYTVVVLAGAVRNLDRNIEFAAATLGARPAFVFRKVVMPTLTPALIAAWLMAFLSSFDELLVTIFLLGRQDPTLPIKMWADIRVELDPTMNAASSVIVTVVIAVVVASQLKSSTKALNAGVQPDQPRTNL